MTKYGEYTAASIAKYSELAEKLKQYWPEYFPNPYTAFPNRVVVFPGGEKYLVIKGCEMHNCGGTSFVIAFSDSTKNLYLLRESSPQVEVFSHPDYLVAKMLFDAYQQN